jgi:hypothetical protein
VLKYAGRNWLIYGERSIQGNRFAVGIRDGDLLRPGVRLGVTTERVFESLKETVAAFPLRVTVVTLWKPLPRMVSVVPPATGPEVGEIVPMPNGTLAS